MIVPDRVYRLTRQIRTPDSRIITAVRRCRVLGVDEETVLVDNEDGTKEKISKEIFEKKLS